jgi:transketolase
LKFICLTENKNYICNSLTFTQNEAYTQQLNDLTIQVRRDILRMVHAVNSGHPGGSLGCTEFLVTLYQKSNGRKEGFEMDGIGEDLFFFKRTYLLYFTAF